MMKKLLLATALAALVPAGANAASYVYVGSWQVDSGPDWEDMPPAYTGQEAAAFLFGGNASDYAISTTGSDAGAVNLKAWYSVIGIADGHEFAHDYSVKAEGGLYYDGSGWSGVLEGSAASAYVRDNAQGSQYINYAFRLVETAVPEPATWGMMIVGFGAIGIGMRRKAGLTRISFA